MNFSIRGLVLRDTDRNDSDKLLTVLTSERGRITVMAKGASSIKSRALSGTQLFTYSEMELYEKTVDERIVANTNAYLCAYFLIIFVSFLLISLDGFSMITNFSATIACFNNIGPGFDAVGATCNYALFSTFSKAILILDMLAGRLEIFPILVLFSARTWKRA